MIEITNLDEFKQDLKEYVKRAFLDVSFQIENEIGLQIDKMNLINNGDLKARGYVTSVTVNGDKIELNLETGLDYAVYIEYGTYAYYNIFGQGSFPKTPDPKKKDMKPKERKNYPKGMQPFAPIRRVLWNKPKMENMISTAFKRQRQ